jgi:hypothetical protein
MTTIREAAMRAISLLSQYAEHAEIDAAFDGGEFSGPASYRAARRKLAQLAAEAGCALSEIEDEIAALSNEGTFCGICGEVLRFPDETTVCRDCKGHPRCADCGAFIDDTGRCAGCRAAQGVSR